MRILLVEDDATLGNAIHRSLLKAGYAVDWAKNGHDGDLALHGQIYEAVVLDIGLPIMNGFEVLRRMRTRKITTPVIILTALDELEDRVKGLDLGADDYLAKPFSLPELEARLRAQIRRSNTVTNSYIEHGALRMEMKDRLITVNDEAMSLSPRELSVLEILMMRAGRVVSKESLMESLCSWNEDVGNNAIEVYVHRLRKKLEPSGINIRTVRGLGYMLSKQESLK